MKGCRAIKLAALAFGAAGALLAWSLPVAAQCAMCKNAVTGSPEAARLSESLNFAIIVLLIPPVLIFCGIFLLAFKYRKARATALEVGKDDKTARGTGVTKGGTRPRRDERETGGALA
jgi:hypothetical protein